MKVMSKHVTRNYFKKNKPDFERKKEKKENLKIKNS